METIVTMAKAIASAYHCNIGRLEIMYNAYEEMYTGKVYLNTDNVHSVFDILENGVVLISRNLAEDNKRYKRVMEQFEKLRKKEVNN